MNNNINTLINSLSNLGEIRKADKNIGELSSTSDFTMSVGTKRRIYHYFPTSKQELIEIIIKKIYNNGNINYECNLNDIDIRGVGFDLSCLFCFAIGYWRDQKEQNNIDITQFNGHIEDWDVSNVVNLNNIFRGCIEFNQNISGWDVSNVKEMQYMFYDCSSFNQNISGWDVFNVKYWSDIFWNCPIKEEYKPKKFS